MRKRTKTGVECIEQPKHPRRRPTETLKLRREIDDVREREQRYRTLFEQSRDPMFVITRDGKIIDVNRSFLKLSGFVRSELSKLDARQLYANPDDRAMFQQQIERQGSVTDFEVKLRKKGGSEIDCLVTATLWRGKNKRVLGYRGSVRDITEHKRIQRALHESEERLRTVVKGAPIVLWALDQRGVFTLSEGKALEALGLKPGEVVGRSIFEVYHDAPQILENNRRALAGGTFTAVVNHGRLTFECRYSPLTNQTGEVIGALGVAVDITERKRAEEEVSMLAHAIRSISECVSITDLEDNVLFVNEAFIKTYGYERDEIIGKHIALLRSANNSPGRVEEILPSTLIRGGWIGKLMNRRKDGTEFPIFLSTSVIRNERGEPVALIGVSTDSSEQEQVVEQIREQAALLDITQDAIIVRDLEDRIVFWNKGCERLYGWRREEAVGKKASEIFLYETPLQFKQATRVLLDKGEWRGEIHQVTKDSKEIIVESRSTLMRDQDGNPRSVLFVNTDITEKKKLEAQFYHAQRMQNIGALASGITHDLNNVLAPILMAIQILKKKLTDQSSQQVLLTLESNAKRGADIVKQVLTFARGMETEHTILQPRQLIQDMARIAMETFPKTVEIAVRVPEVLWSVSGDPTQLHQVLMNLCVNARDAMPQGGTLTIGAANVQLDESYVRMNPPARVGPFVSLFVADTGTGISAQIRDKIFDPFFTTKQSGGGTGLGLATVSSLAKAHGGFATMESEVGKGTTFTVYLPAVQTAEKIRVEEEDTELPEGHGECVLVVDDEASIREITKDTLELYGYRVFTASDGTEAVARYVEHKDRIDIVLTDMVMPYMDGPSEIRALERINPHVKVIAMSGVTSDSKVGQIEHLRVKAFLRKPYTAEKLLKTIKEILSE